MEKARKAKRKSKKKKALWETFVEKGANYSYTGKPEPLLITDKLVSGFEIFAEEVNRMREPVVKEAVVEELVLSEEPEKVILAAEQKKAVD